MKTSMKISTLLAVVVVSVLLILPEEAMGRDRCAKLAMEDGTSPGDPTPVTSPYVGNPNLNVDTITVYVTDNVRNSKHVTSDKLEAAFEKWSSVCDQVEDSFPQFVLDWDNPRPSFTSQSDPLYRSTLLFDMVNDKPTNTGSGGNLELGKFTAVNGTVTLSRDCPGNPTPCKDGQINWGNTWGVSALGHEIGHALGLGHDGPGCAVDTIMRPVVGPSSMWDVKPNVSHCFLLKKLQDLEQPCNNGGTVTDPDVHPCEDEFYAEQPTPPQARLPNVNLDVYATLDICNGIYGWSCTTNHQRSCHVEVISYVDNLGNQDSWTEWRCDNGLSGLVGLDNQGGVGVGEVQGVGPLLKVKTPLADSSLSGDYVISGWAVDYSGVANYEFFVDGEPVILNNFRRNILTPEACNNLLMTYRHLCDARAGFEGVLDVRQFSRGWHELNIKVIDSAGWSSVINRSIFMEGCDTIPPIAEIVTHQGGTKVSGLVMFGVEAEDDDKVSRTQLFVDGVRVGSDWNAPYILNWDSRTVADGRHVIQPRAVDACLNVGAGPSLEVVVDNVPDCETIQPNVSIVAPTSGASVSGTTNITASASDNVGVQRVEFFVDGVRFHTDNSSPFLFQWNTEQVTEGLHQLNVRAWDSCGNSKWASATTRVMVDNHHSCDGSSLVDLCFGDGRYSVNATINGERATALHWSDNGGFFTLDEPDGAEIAVKYLNGQSVNGRHWFFHGALTPVPYSITITDARNGRSRTLSKEANSLCGGADTETFADDSWLFGDFVTTGGCVPTTTAVCLMNSRFKVEVKRGRDFQRGYAVTDKTSSFGFGMPGAPEVVVKLYDGRWVNGHHWLFFGSLTTEYYSVRVTDTLTGTTKFYGAPGELCGSADGAAF
jgi:hypothetical protein